MSNDKTSIERATEVSHFVHMAMGFLTEIILPLIIGIMSGYTVSLLGDNAPSWAISVASIAMSVIFFGLSHRMICVLIKSSAPCALSVLGRLMFPVKLTERVQKDA